MFDPNQLDQVNDVVQRLGYSDKRKRNQALRAGMENPGAFQEQNSGIIKEAQQPTDFMGAGRKLAANQNPDSSIANLFQGNLTKHGNDWYSYGDTDYSNYQFGTQGYNLKKKGSGIGLFDILDQGGNSIGTSYSSTYDAIRDYGEQNRQNYLATLPEDYSPGVRYEEGGYAIQNEDPRSTPAYIPNYGSELRNWEALSQILRGNVVDRTGGYIPVNTYNIPGADSLSNQPHNKYGDIVSGLETLYGSTPLIDRSTNKLMGYKMDLGPGADSSPFSETYTKNSKREQMQSQLWRELQNPDEWGRLGKPLDNTGGFFVPTENAAKLPGWSNEDSWQYKKAPTGGLPKGMKLLSSVLKFTPLAPMAYMMDLADGSMTGNYTSTLANLFSMGMNMGASDMAGAAGVDQMPSGGFSGADLADFTTPSRILSNTFGNYAPMVVGAAGGAIANKGNPFIGALGGAGGAAASSLTSGDGLQNIVSKLTGGAANRGIQSLFNQNREIKGSEYAGRSGGLNAFLNQTPTTGDINQQALSEEEKAEVIADYRRRMIQQAQRGA